MNKKTVQRVLEINEEIKRLEAARDAISGPDMFRLSFGRELFDDERNINWQIVEEHELKPIRHILNRYDSLIRQEIDQAIEQLEKQLEAL